MRTYSLGEPRPEVTEGLICVYADKHQPDEVRGGCTCGFCAWSPGHVAVMAFREACEHVGRRSTP